MAPANPEPNRPGTFGIGVSSVVFAFASFDLTGVPVDSAVPGDDDPFQKRKNTDNAIAMIATAATTKTVRRFIPAIDQWLSAAQVALASSCAGCLGKKRSNERREP